MLHKQVQSSQATLSTGCRTAIWAALVVVVFGVGFAESGLGRPSGLAEYLATDVEIDSDNVELRSNENCKASIPQSLLAYLDRK
jgi:hypothetical protein